MFIKAVRFIPLEENTYEIFISQGSSFYRQNISSLEYKSINTIMLDEPFVIDASGALIVSIYISKVGTDYPATGDGGPVVNGKGNIYSFDGEDWMSDESVPGEDDYNFIVSALVSTESGKNVEGGDDGKTLNPDTEIPKHRSETGFGAVKRRVSMLPFNENTVSLRSSMPAAFPEVTKYRIYCNDLHRDVNAAKSVYVEKISPSTSEYKFQVSAFYGDVESDRSNEDTVIVDVGNVNVDLYPVRFSNVISLRGHSSVIRIEVFSVSGKVCLVVNNPGEVIDSSSLSPGLYFFRIYGSNNKVLKVVKAIKTS
jgi:hypothetical protein